MTTTDPTTDGADTTDDPTDDVDLARHRRRLFLVGLDLAPGPTVAYALATLATTVLSTAGAVVSARVIGRLPGAVAAGWDSAPGRSLQAAVVGVGLVFLARHVVAAGAGVASFLVKERVDRRLRQRVMARTAGVPGVAHLEDPSIADLVARAKGGGVTEITVGMAVQGWIAVAGQRLGAVVAGIWLATIEWWLPLAVAATGVLLLRQMVRHLWSGVELTILATTKRRRANYLADLALRPDAAKELRVFGLGPWLRHEHATEFAAATAGVWLDHRSSRRRLVVPIAAQFVATAATLLGVVELVEAGAIGLTELATVTMLLGLLRSGVTNVDNNLLQIEHGVAGLPALDELERRLDDDPVIHLTGTAAATGLPRHRIELDGVGFTYPGTDAPIYDGLDLTIEAGSSVAVVGVNGAGKTTLVKLLGRLYDPTEGQIRVDGIPLTELDPASWQPRVSAIFQDFTRYHLSARDNVCFGAPHADVGDDALRAAAADAGILDAIEALPSGWDTVLSRQYEGGADLSGGQWQRLALARALLAVRHGAGVLVLDEPTANLDVRAEAELYDRFLDLTRGVTSIVISHRFSTVRRADRIVVLDEGRVVEDGTHDELVALGGRYAAAFAVQAARFADDAGDAGDATNEAVEAGATGEEVPA